jgi:hypothetical protein
MGNNLLLLLGGSLEDGGLNLWDLMLDPDRWCQLNGLENPTGVCGGLEVGGEEIPTHTFGFTRGEAFCVEGKREESCCSSELPCILFSPLPSLLSFTWSVSLVLNHSVLFSRKRVAQPQGTGCSPSHKQKLFKVACLTFYSSPAMSVVPWTKKSFRENSLNFINPQ